MPTPVATKLVITRFVPTTGGGTLWGTFYDAEGGVVGGPYSQPIVASTMASSITFGPYSGTLGDALVTVLSGNGIPVTAQQSAALVTINVPGL